MLSIKSKISPIKILISIILFTEILFSGCNDPDSNEANTVTVNFQQKTVAKFRWLGHWYGEGKKELLIRELARDFGFLNQDIDLELQFPHEMLGTNENMYSLLIDSIYQMVKTDTWPYDILPIGTYVYKTIGTKLNDPNWGQKYLVDFSKEPWFINSHKDCIFENNNFLGQTGNIAPGAFLEGGWEILYTSTEVEEKLGLKVKYADMDIEDFIAYAKKVYEYNSSHEDKLTFFSLIRGNLSYDFLFRQLAMSALGKDRGTREEVYGALKEAYHALERLVPYKPLEQNYSYENDLQLNADKALFIFYFSYISSIWEQNNPEGEKMMQPCELPSLTGRKATIYPGYYNLVFSIPKKSKNVETAKKLMQFISTSETAEKWQSYAKCPTGLKSTFSYNDFGKDKFGQFAQHIKQKYNDRLYDGSFSLLLFNTDKELIFNVAEVLRGELTADQAYKKLLEQLKGI